MTAAIIISLCGIVVMISALFAHYARAARNRQIAHLRKQIAEDTCEAHNVFCCENCF